MSEFLPSCSPSWKESRRIAQFNHALIIAKWERKAKEYGDDDEMIDIQTLTVIPGTERKDGTSGFDGRDFGVESPIVAFEPDENPGVGFEEEETMNKVPKRKCSLPMIGAKRRRVSLKTDDFQSYSANLPTQEDFLTACSMTGFSYEMENIRKGVSKSFDLSPSSKCSGRDFEDCVSECGSSFADLKQNYLRQREMGENNELNGFARPKKRPAAVKNRPKRRICVTSSEPKSIVTPFRDENQLGIIHGNVHANTLERTVRRSARNLMKGKFGNSGAIVVQQKFRIKGREDLERLRKNGFVIAPGILKNDFQYEMTAKRLFQENSRAAFHLNDETLSIKSGFLPSVRPNLALPQNSKSVIHNQTSQNKIVPFGAKNKNCVVKTPKSRMKTKDLEMSFMKSNPYFEKWIKNTRKLTQTRKFYLDPMVSEFDEEIKNSKKITNRI